jgi:hypothetical protein
MTLYEVRSDRLVAAADTTFAREKVSERYGLQRLLRDQIEVLDPDLFVLDEEFCDWDASLRRIDLLCLDSNANIVVVELKVTDDGGHMELQALRYAAMVSTMTFEHAEAAHARYLSRREISGDARARILEFLGWSSPAADQFGADVRILLVSQAFSREITTTVLWLRDRDVDIRCVRLKPYKVNEQFFLDVHQVIPLPEAEEYQIKVQQKGQQERASRRVERSMEAVWAEIDTKLSADEARVAHDLESWLTSIPTKVFPVSKGFAQWVRLQGRDQYFFKVGTDGFVEVWFRYLSAKPPFADDSLREELRKRLNSIAGIELPADRLRGKPRFALSALLDAAALATFKSVWQWAIDRMSADESCGNDLVTQHSPPPVD